MVEAVSAEAVMPTTGDQSLSQANAGFLDLARHGRLPQLREQLAKSDAAERRARLQAEDEHGNTALLLAIIHEYPNVASLLLQFPETDAVQTNRRGQTALSLAARSKRPFVVSAVLHRLLCVERLDRVRRADSNPGRECGCFTLALDKLATARSDPASDLTLCRASSCPFQCWRRCSARVPQAATASR